MSTVIHKLKMLKQSLKVWNREFFGNVFKRIHQAQASLERIQNEIVSLGFSDDRHEQEIAALNSLNEAQKLESEFMRENARVKWLHDGDRNASYFHRLVNIKKANNIIRTMEINGNMC